MADNAKKERPKRGVLRLISVGSTSQGGQSEALKLRRDATIFGREKGDVLIDDTEISATHCQIQNIKGAYHIFDMNSTNGTFVNGERIVKAKLNPGDELRVGSTVFRFQLEDEARVRHLSTMFRTGDSSTDSRGTVVDTLIESELKSRRYRLRLHVEYPGRGREELIINQRVVYIGRATSFGHFDQDTEISRKHLLIKVNDGGEVFVEDQNSTNGSFLNGEKISGMHKVQPNDVVKVGGCLLRIAACE